MGKVEEKKDWYSQSIKVFMGDFTVDDDKWKLVDTVMGLWYLALLNEKRADNAMLKKLVQTNKEEVFPKLYFKELIEMLEESVRSKLEENEQQEEGVHHRELVRAYTQSTSLGG